MRRNENLTVYRVADSDLTWRYCSCLFLFRIGRDFLRILPGKKGIAARSYRGSQVRIKKFNKYSPGFPHLTYVDVGVESLIESVLRHNLRHSACVRK